MQKSWVLLVGLWALSGCALESDTAPTTADTSDPACLSVAAARARDAAINGYDTDVQAQIRDASYKSCVAWAQKAALVEPGHR